jgi:hypothetical protein
MTPPGIDPGTVRLVAQRLNHYATPGPSELHMIYIYLLIINQDHNILPVIFYSQNVARIGENDVHRWTTTCRATDK